MSDALTYPSRLGRLYGSSRLGSLAARWRSRLPWVQVWLAVLLMVATVVAYHFTLSSLLDFLRLDTPLAYLPLLPLFAAWTAITIARRRQGDAAPVRDRQMDLLLGLPLLLVAILMITVLPAVWSTYYWTERPDVLSLALFVAAGVNLLFGTTWFWRLKAPLFFLVLMWPALYLHLMGGVLQTFTDATNATLAAIIVHLPVGATAAGAPGLISVNVHNGQPLLVSVGTACSGANSVLGFLLIGGAMLALVRGRLLAKLGWLATGLALTFALNVVRLISILALAAVGYPDFALGQFHAVIGLVLFSAALLLMTRVYPLFRLTYDRVPKRNQDAAVRPSVSVSRGKRVFGYLVIAGFFALTLVAAVADGGLLPYAAFANGSGAPTVTALSVHSPLPKGWHIWHGQTYDWAKQYFGANSSFDSYFVSQGSNQVVTWVDVVRTDDRGSLDAYNLQSCFLFHNYTIRTARRIDLGSGVTGLLLNYEDPSSGTIALGTSAPKAKARWATVSWAWPVHYRGDTYYERVTLTATLQPGQSAGPDLRPSSGMRAVVLDFLNAIGSRDVRAADQADYRSADVALERSAASLVGAIVRPGPS
jgi:exosortase/archaeosortase family protein